jgi:hypothetical protein
MTTPILAFSSFIRLVFPGFPRTHSFRKFTLTTDLGEGMPQRKTEKPTCLASRQLNQMAVRRYYRGKP